MRKRKAAPQDKNQDTLLGEIQRLRKQVHQLELERDILTKANELIKKDLGISFLKLKNGEKTLIVDALKKKGTVAKLAMRQPFVLFKGLTFQKLCLPGAFRPGDHHNKMLRPGLCVVHASPQYL